jgi:hypothetical protein
MTKSSKKSFTKPKSRTTDGTKTRFEKTKTVMKIWVDNDTDKLAENNQEKLWFFQ